MNAKQSNDMYAHGKSVTILLVSVGTTVKVHVVDLENERVVHPVNVRPLLSWTVQDLYALIHKVR